MNIADSVQETTAGTSTSTVVVNGATANNRTFAAAVAAGAFSVGATNIPLRVEDDAGNWLTGAFTLSAPSGVYTLTRTAIGASSAAGADVTLAGTVRKVSIAPISMWARTLSSVATAAFATAIPMTSIGVTYMPQQTVASVLAFTIAASPVQGALVYLRLIADGTNAPTFAGFKEWGGSLGYDNRAGIVNEVQFFYDGYDYWFSISQAVGAVAVDATAPTASSAAVANGTPTIINITMSEALDPAFVPAASTVTISGHTVTALAISGSTLNATVSAAFVNAEAARVGVYTQNGTNNLRDIAGNLLANFSGLAITNNVAAPATVPATMAAPSASAGLLSASVAFTVPTNGGAAITGYLVTASTGQTASGTTSPISITMPGGVAATFTIHATNSVGNSVESSASNSVTPSSAATAPATMAAPVATAGDTTASVVMAAPSNGGSAITGYTVTSIPAGGTDSNAGTTGLTHAITGLTNGTAYTFTATATNAIGTSTASAASNSVTPAAVAIPRFTALSGMVEGGSSPSYAYSAAATGGFGTFGGVLNLHLPASTDGSISLTNVDGYELILCVTSTTNPAAVQAFTACPNALWTGATGGNYGVFTTGSAGTVANTVAQAANDIMRLRRAGTTLVAEVARSATPTVFTTIYTWTGVTTAQLGFQVSVQHAVIGSLTGVGLA